MSVPQWRRKLSHTEFLHKAFVHAQEIGKFVANKPKKYKQNYGDCLIKNSLEIIKYCQMANAIYIGKGTTLEDFKERKRLFRTAKALTEHQGTVLFIFMHLCRDSDRENWTKLADQVGRLGETLYELSELIGGVMKSDSKRLSSARVSE